MKRTALLQHLRKHGCVLKREGASHSLWHNPRTGSDLLPPAGRGPRKHWAWLRGDVKAMDDWRRSLASMKAAGIDAILIGGSAEFYRRAVPAAAAEGLELHAWIFTMMRGEHLQTHPDWYAVSRAGMSTAAKPPYVDYYRFMCPSRDEVRQWLAGYVRELAEIEGLASVHLDYIRYPDVILPVALWSKYNLVQDQEYPEFDFCYCAVCRDRFTERPASTRSAWRTRRPTGRGCSIAATRLPTWSA